VREDLILTLKVFVSECTTASLDILPVADDRSLQIHKVGTKSQPDKQDSAQQEEKVELPICGDDAATSERERGRGEGE